MKRMIVLLLICGAGLSFTGCGKNKAADTLDVEVSVTSSVTGTVEQGNVTEPTDFTEPTEATEQTKATGHTDSQGYDSSLRVFVVDNRTLELQWTFAEGTAFGSREMQVDQQFPRVELIITCGENEFDSKLDLSCRYASMEGETEQVTLAQLMSNFTKVLGFYGMVPPDTINAELQENTIIWRVTVPETPEYEQLNIDFMKLKWFRTAIVYGSDMQNAYSAEYTDSIVTTDYSQNPYPDSRYISNEAVDTVKEIKFEDQSFTVDSNYYTITKYEVPLVRVFDYVWYYSEAWDQWSFEARDERASKITEYQLINYDELGNELARQTRTVFPTQEDALSTFRDTIGFSEHDKDLSISTIENRENYLLHSSVFADGDIAISGNTLSNGEFFRENVLFNDSLSLDDFKPDSDGYASASKPYQLQVEGGFVDSSEPCSITVYYSDNRLHEMLTQ